MGSHQSSAQDRIATFTTLIGVLLLSCAAMLALMWSLCHAPPGLLPHFCEVERQQSIGKG